MVNVTSLTGNGLKDWLIQRVTAVYLLLYTLMLIYVYVRYAPFDYQAWQALFHCSVFQVTTAIAGLAIVFHAWVGIWTVTTDYIKPTCIRLMTQGVVLFILIAELMVLYMTIWGR